MSKTEMGCRLWICYQPSVGSRLVGRGSSRRVSSVKSVSLGCGLAARQLKNKDIPRWCVSWSYEGQIVGPHSIVVVPGQGRPVHPLSRGKHQSDNNQGIFSWDMKLTLNDVTVQVGKSKLNYYRAPLVKYAKAADSFRVEWDYNLQ
ncbi:hypothetical protein TIFTF001_019004 [Ficus carica]|uniref:Uncharacterized protein n=1 Tax=Ficus carica TaxID=3494 RepID=A0AA88DBB4_FICCA|nr:hypothetical protein TIFTF001_019004 [Ficus carica]